MKAEIGETPEHAIQELVSAQSSLNTYPDFYKDKLNPSVYLTDQIAMVAHAYEHIAAAIKTLRKVQNGTNSKTESDTYARTCSRGS